ncbi:sensor histidine kinase [Sinosporangium siamense]|uniref:histidine kinase n=1 Tax=Sinosporangium siamense TaxID=1367973 RepID=A0A919RGS3_9ACTN|nr:sensor histidine kinase [Sinosporangium siamense]GII93595.1 hypothetical protein Ssi02_38260 [Sinosporangium siamense]
MKNLPAWVADVVLGVTVALVLTAVISANHGGSQRADLVAYLWAAGLGALMLARRRHPRAVLVVTALGLFAYYAAGYPAIGVAVPVAAALFSAAEAGRLAASVLTAVTVVAVSLVFRLLEGQDTAFVVGYDLVPHVVLMVAAVALGDSLRARRSQRAHQRDLAALTAMRHAEEMEHRVHEERLSIARDLHDSIGHTLSVISLHSDVAREAIGRDDRDAVSALVRIKEATSATMRELRTTVALLRSPGERASRVVSLRDVDALLATARSAGIDVVSRIDPAVAGLPSMVDAAAYRIAQEAVTNVVRHSGASQVHIETTIADGTLTLTVADNGRARPPATPTGQGITGMTERARALGGTLTTRREPTGFTVHARLPVETRP